MMLLVYKSYIIYNPRPKRAYRVGIYGIWAIRAAQVIQCNMYNVYII